MIRISKILFPTDFSDFSRYAASFAVSFAFDYGAKLYVLHVVDFPPAMAEMVSTKIPFEKFCAKTKELARDELVSASTADVVQKLNFEVGCEKGPPFLEIIRYARERAIDMIVMGTHGRSALESVLLGSTTEKVLRNAPCPVLTVRRPGHRFVMPAVG